MKQASSFQLTHPYEKKKKKKSVMAFQIFGATDMKSCTTFCFAFVVFVFLLSLLSYSQLLSKSLRFQLNIQQKHA